jgi:hypothetical protein
MIEFAVVSVVAVAVLMAGCVSIAVVMETCDHL